MNVADGQEVQPLGDSKEQGELGGMTLKRKSSFCTRRRNELEMALDSRESAT